MLSRDNKNVKQALKLKQKKYREAEGKHLIEGIRFVEEAIQEGVVDCLFVSERLGRNEDKDRVLGNELSKYEVEESVLKELAGTENPQGIVAVARRQEYGFSDIGDGIVVITDGVQDPGNLGTIIRTADAVGAGAVVLVKGTVDLYNDKVLRSTMGSIFHVPIISCDSFEELVTVLTGRGYEVYASSLAQSQDLYECDLRGNVAIVIGNEANGISDEHLKLATHRVRIPMPGRAESLNAAVAGAVMMYEAVRQRRR